MTGNLNAKQIAEQNAIEKQNDVDVERANINLMVLLRCQ